MLLIGSCSQESKQSGPENIQVQGAKSDNNTDTVPIMKDTIAVQKIDSVKKDSIAKILTDSTILGIRKDFPMPSGRVVNVLITGIDSRLGQKSARADANHIVRFFLDSGCIEIISIPRGTFAMIRKGDTSGGNIIANVRSIFGQERYIREITKIAKVKSIDYYIEFGFSQAMGIIELLGYKDNAASTLRVLRSRKAFTTGDHQRSYNQGQFIRQAILKVFDQTDALVGKVGIRAALALANTNLSYDATNYLLDEVRKHGFSSMGHERIWVRMKPNYLSQMKHLNFDSANVEQLESGIEKRVKGMLEGDRKTPEGYAKRLQNLVKKAAVDSAKNPARVINSLVFPFQQKAWMQVKDKQERVHLRNRICTLLIDAFNRTNKTVDAKTVQDYLQLEQEAYQH
jgi:anionic cell wall polymer biosynthesis LytR-Cps2A-Psr (LCP) family protein